MLPNFFLDTLPTLFDRTRHVKIPLPLEESRFALQLLIAPNPIWIEPGIPDGASGFVAVRTVPKSARGRQLHNLRKRIVDPFWVCPQLQLSQSR
jgi:hypothetical protein